MNPFIPSLLLLLFSLIPFSLATTAIEDACKSIARADSSIPYNFCVTILKSEQKLNHYPNRPSDHTLADIAIEAAYNLAREIYLRVSHLSAMEGRQGWAETEEELRIGKETAAKKQRYQQCSEMYLEATKNLGQAATRISKKRYGKAKELVRAASGAYGKCVSLYRGTGHLREMPVTRTDRVDFDRVLKITRAILSMAHRDQNVYV